MYRSLDGLCVVLGVDAFCCAKLLCHVELGRLQVHADDARRAAHLGSAVRGEENETSISVASGKSDTDIHTHTDININIYTFAASITARPTAPRPKTATELPFSTFAVLKTAPQPVDRPQPSRQICMRRSERGVRVNAEGGRGPRDERHERQERMPVEAKENAACEPCIAYHGAHSHQSDKNHNRNNAIPLSGGQTLSSGAVCGTSATDSACTTVYSLNVLVPM
jgi:hypothetical protein